MEITRARTVFEADPNSELVAAYFGTELDQNIVDEKMILAAQRGRSGKITFTCQDETIGECAARPGMAFYNDDTEWLRTDGWLMNVCGTRFWEPDYVNGYDGDNSASQLGIMVHELAHLGGALSDEYTLDEAGLKEAVMNPSGSAISWNYAEAYRQYVMHAP